MSGVTKHPGGRPTKLTPTVMAKIVELLRAGSYRDVAAKSAGVTRSTLNLWFSRGSQAKSGIYREFVDAVERAMADAEARAVAQIAKAAAGGDWKASAWYLERMHPCRWGRRDRVDATVSGAITHVNVNRVDLSHLSTEDLNTLEKLYAKILPPSDPSGDGSSFGESGEGAA